MVTAKFRCTSKATVQSEGASEPTVVVKFYPAHGKGNEEWSKWTPSGNLEMYITNPGAHSQFTPGKEYLLTFEEQ